MCLVIDSSVLVANTYLFSKRSCLDYKEIRKYSNLLLKEISSMEFPVMFSNDNFDSYFSIGKCNFIKAGKQVLVQDFYESEYQQYLLKVYSQKIVDLMNEAGQKYLAQLG